MKKTNILFVLTVLVTLLFTFSSCYYEPISTKTVIESIFTEEWYEEHKDDTTFEIGTSQDLKAFRDLVNSGKDFEGKTIKLTSDLDVSDEKWVSIGPVIRTKDDAIETGIQTYIESHPSVFKGIFDGDGHTVKINIVNDATEESYVGFFGIVGGNGEIKNLTIDGTISSSLTTKTTVAGVVGAIYSQQDETFKVTNCTNKATFDVCKDGEDNESAVSGIVARVYGFGSAEITGCKNESEIISNGYTSGIVATSGYDAKYLNTLKALLIDNCINSGKIAGLYSGGIIGWYPQGFDGLRVTNNTNTGDITIGNEKLSYDQCMGTKWMTGELGQITGRDLSAAVSREINFSGNNQEGRLFDLDGTLLDATKPNYTLFNNEWAVENNLIVPDTLIIKHTRDLKGFRDFVNRGPGDLYGLVGKTIILDCDIDISDEEWIPVGSTTRGSDKSDSDITAYFKQNKSFKGTFDGNGHYIKYKMTNEETTEETFVGFFGIVGGNGTIKDLTLKGEIVNKKKTDATVAGIVGGTLTKSDETFTISGCTNEVIITSEVTEEDLGGVFAGILGRAYGKGTVKVENCTNTANISSNTKSAGIVGVNRSTMKEFILTGSTNTGDIKGEHCTGGIISVFNSAIGKIENCTNSGTILSTYDNGKVGGTSYSQIVAAFGTQGKDIPQETYNAKVIDCQENGSIV